MVLVLSKGGALLLSKVLHSCFNFDVCVNIIHLLTWSQAFCPGLIVPGIGYSDDKLLQSRIFSYSDTQRHRLGPNYLTLPVNAPKSNHHNNHHEGFMNPTIRDEEVRVSTNPSQLLRYTHLGMWTPPSLPSYHTHS